MSEIVANAVEKIMAGQQEFVAGYVARLRRAQAEATPTQIIAVLEKRYLVVVTGVGAVVGSVGALPAVGAVLAGVFDCGEAMIFLEATALFALAVAQVHGIRVEDRQRCRTLVLALVAGDHGAMLVEKMVGRTGEHWADLLPNAIPMSSIISLNRSLSDWLVNKYGGKRSIVTMGKVAPFGVKAAVVAGGNYAFGRTVVNTSRRVFGPPALGFSDDGVMVADDGSGVACATVPPGRRDVS